VLQALPAYGDGVSPQLIIAAQRPSYPIPDRTDWIVFPAPMMCTMKSRCGPIGLPLRGEALVFGAGHRTATPHLPELVVPDARAKTHLTKAILEKKPLS